LKDREWLISPKRGWFHHLRLHILAWIALAHSLSSRLLIFPLEGVLFLVCVCWFNKLPIFLIHSVTLNPLKMDLSVCPPFYKSLFKVWSLFHIQKTENPYSLYLLMQEPLILGAWLDINDKKQTNTHTHTHLYSSQFISAVISQIRQKHTQEN